MKTNYTEGVSEVTERDREDAQSSQHIYCLECYSRLCKTGDDGLLLSPCSCDDPIGEPVRDELGIIGYVHSRCREQLLVKQLQQDIERALKIRLPLGVEVWATERAANIATAVFQRGHEMGLRFAARIEVKGD